MTLSKVKKFTYIFGTYIYIYIHTQTRTRYSTLMENAVWILISILIFSQNSLTKEEKGLSLVISRY